MSENQERDPNSIFTPPAARGEVTRGDRLRGLRIAVIGAGQQPSSDDPNPPEGNGRAIAIACAMQGASVACIDRNEASARETAKRIEQVGGRAITLTFDQFKYSWANALDEQEARELYDGYHVAASGASLMQMGNANLNPRTQAKVDTKNPARGPLLIIDGEKDHTVPWAIANSAYKRQRRNPGVTEIVKMPDRGHALTIDHGWREVAQTALDFVKRFA